MSEAIDTVVVDGLALAETLRDEMAREIEAIVASGRRPPQLTVVLVGDDPASRSYIKGKQRACARIGAAAAEYLLPESTSEKELLDLIGRLNADDAVDGILVQLPLPKTISPEAVAEAIDPAKDVDALHPLNFGRLLLGNARLISCTPLGVLAVLDRHGITLAGAHAVVIGRSNIVGKPVSILLQQRNATVTMCHSKTRDLAGLCRSADVIVAAAGNPRMVKGDWIRPGAAVMDVGVSEVDGKLVGDVDFEAAIGRAGLITPSRRGIGPMTITMLLRNTLTAYSLRMRIPAKAVPEPAARSARLSELLRTPLYETHRRLGARLVPFAGYEMPIQYTSILEEHAAVRERAGLFDVSHMGQIHFSGPGAVAAVDALVTCDVTDLSLGRARYGLMLNDEGGCVDDVIVTRLGESELFLCVNASNVEKDRSWIEAHVPREVVVDDRSAATALIALQGPASPRILARFAGAEIALPKRFRVARLELRGISLLVSATGYTGAPGFELYCANADAEPLFSGLLAAGESEGIRPAGLGARDTLRLEAGMALYGHELDDTTTPFEAGLERYVKDLARTFVGAAALRAQSGDPPRRRLVGFELTDRGIARADYEIIHAEKIVGRVTSGAPSPTLGKSIGLGYVPPALSGIGQALSIRIRNKDIAARVVALPFLR